jgi:hypothetical protein
MIGTSLSFSVAMSRDRPLADLKGLRQIQGAHMALALDEQQDGKETVDAIHRGIGKRAGDNSVSPRPLPAAWPQTLQRFSDSYSMEASSRSQSSYPCWSRSDRSPAHMQPRWPGTTVVLYPVCAPSTLKHAKMRST